MLSTPQYTQPLFDGALKLPALVPAQVTSVAFVRFDQCAPACAFPWHTDESHFDSITVAERTDQFRLCGTPPSIYILHFNDATPQDGIAW